VLDAAAEKFASLDQRVAMTQNNRVGVRALAAAVGTSCGERVIANRNVLIVADQHETRGDTSPCFRSRPPPQIGIQLLDAAGEALSIVPLR